jgi:hypothetical protein
MAMTQAANRDPGQKIEKLPPIGIFQPTTTALNHRHRITAIGIYKYLAALFDKFRVIHFTPKFCKIIRRIG